MLPAFLHGNRRAIEIRAALSIAIRKLSIRALGGYQKRCMINSLFRIFCLAAIHLAAR
jgi:hypothetical protein